MSDDDITTDTITKELEELNRLLETAISSNEKQFAQLYEEINRLKTSKIEEVRAAAGENEEELKQLRAEKEVLTNYWHEIVEIKKGKKIDDFRDVKVT